MKSNQQGTQWDDNQLVAFLDGELPSQDQAELERSLALDPGLRQRLEELKSAWDLLDELPAATTNARLAQSTIELVAMELVEHRRHNVWTTRLRNRWWLLGLLSLLAFGIGAGLALFQHQSSMQQLVRLLPVLANYSDLSLIDDPSWLEKLTEVEGLLEAGLPLFVESGFPNSPTKPAELHDWVKGLEAPLQIRLLEDYQSYQALEPSRKESMQNVSQLVQARSAVDYAQVLKAYSGLVRQIGSTEFAQLEAEQDLDQRAAKIQKVVYRELAIGYANRLTQEEREGIRQWANQLKEEHFEYFFSIEDPDSEIVLMLDLPSANSIVKPQDIEELTNRIGPAGRSLLSRLDESQRSKTLRLWVYSSLPGSQNRPELSSLQMKKIFDSLPIERQNELIYMPGPEVIRTLKQIAAPAAP
jgi:hypothetical protein